VKEWKKIRDKYIKMNLEVEEFHNLVQAAVCGDNTSIHRQSFKQGI